MKNWTRKIIFLIGILVGAVFAQEEMKIDRGVPKQCKECGPCPQQTASQNPICTCFDKLVFQDADIKAIFAVAADKRKPAQKKKLVEAFKKGDSGRAKLAKVFAEASKPLPPDPKVKELQDKLSVAQKPIPMPPRIARLRRDDTAACLRKRSIC